jgi:hypothetical protein
VPDDLKEQLERWAGDQFIEWRNENRGGHHAFRRHGQPPDADLEYTDGTESIHIEVTGSYYGDDGARFENMNARELRDAPQGWSSMKADGTVVPIGSAVLEFLDTRLSEKAGKSYSRPPILLIHHISRLQHSAELRQVLAQVVIPAQHPFVGIYFLARLPHDDPEGRLLVHPLEAEP